MEKVIFHYSEASTLCFPRAAAETWLNFVCVCVCVSECVCVVWLDLDRHLCATVSTSVCNVFPLTCQTKNYLCAHYLKKSSVIFTRNVFFLTESLKRNIVSPPVFLKSRLPRDVRFSYYSSLTTKRERGGKEESSHLHTPELCLFLCLSLNTHMHTHTHSLSLFPVSLQVMLMV